MFALPTLCIVASGTSLGSIQTSAADVILLSSHGYDEAIAAWRNFAGTFITTQVRG